MYIACNCLPRRKIICGFRPPRWAIQRRIGVGYIEYSIWVASGLVIGAAIGAEIPGGMEAESGVRGHADLVMGNRAEHDGAGRGAQAVDDDGLAGSAQALVFVDIGSDPAAAVIGNADHCMARAHALPAGEPPRATPSRTSCPSPSPNLSNPNLIALCDARLRQRVAEIVILSRRRGPLKSNSNQVLQRALHPAARKGPELEQVNESVWRCAIGAAAPFAVDRD